MFLFYRLFQRGLGVVILEALATGVPVVASRVGGIPDILTHEYNGLLVEPRDVEDFAEAIVRILSDDKLKRRLIEGGLATIWRTRENEIEKLLSKLIFEK
jgi:glycosyltransferase involved in cell wall biosynthesis